MRFPMGWGRSLSGVVTHHFGNAHFYGSKPSQEILHEVPHWLGEIPIWGRDPPLWERSFLWFEATSGSSP